MSMNDTLAAALSKIDMAEQRKKSLVEISPASKLLQNVLRILKEEGYIEDYTVEEDAHGSRVIVQLNGSINRVGVIKPRAAVSVDGYEKYEKRYLLAKDFGFLIVSTNKGLMTHQQAKAQNLGGRLIAYCY